MHAIDPHALSIAYRLIHAAGMAVLLGGAVLVALGFGRGEGTRSDAVGAAARYERWFWPVIAVQALTGVGNAGMLGASLPGPATPWGGWLALKLVAVGVALVASLIRTGVIVQLVAAPEASVSTRGGALLRGLYAGTAGLLAVVVFLAVRLAHG